LPSDSFVRAELLRKGGLRDRLFALIDQAGLRAKDVAERLGNDPSKLSRIKKGQAPTESDIRIWAEVCHADPNPLLQMLTEAQQAARVDRLGERPNQADTQERYIELYRVTSLVREFQSAVVPGMLQTSSYARQMFVETKDLHGQLDNLPDDIEKAVTARLARQAMLYEPDHSYEFLIDEPVLRRLIVSPAVLRAQLDRIHNTIGLPNVRIGVIPMTSRLKAVPWLPITVFAGKTTEVLIETPAEERFYAGEDGAPFVNVIDRLWSSAVEGDEAARLVIAARDSLPRE
jgi:transcriptional regulator with XRE-family HTH domain